MAATAKIRNISVSILKSSSLLLWATGACSLDGFSPEWSGVHHLLVVVWTPERLSKMDSDKNLQQRAEEADGIKL